MAFGLMMIAPLQITATDHSNGWALNQSKDDKNSLHPLFVVCYGTFWHQRQEVISRAKQFPLPHSNPLL